MANRASSRRPPTANREPSPTSLAQESSELDECDFSVLFGRYLHGKDALPELLQAVAVSISCDRLRPHLRHPIAIEAVDAARAFAENRIDKPELAKARRKLLRLMKGLDSSPRRSVWDAAYARTTYFATLFPIKSNELMSLIGMLINARTNEEHAKDKSVDWGELETRMKREEYAAAAKIILRLLPPETRSQWSRQEPPRFRFRDPRFAARQYEGTLLLLQKKGVSASEYQGSRTVLQAFQDCQEADPIDDSTVRPIVEASLSEIKRLRKMAIHFLIGLAPYSEAARQGLFGGLENRSSVVRFDFVSAVGYYRRPYDRSFILKFFDRALRDRSSKVRQFASQGCNHAFECRELVPLLEEIVKVETNPTVRKAIEHDIGYLRDGFYLDDDSDRDFVFVSVKSDRGGFGYHLSRERYALLTPQKLLTFVEALRREEDGCVDVDSIVDSIIAE